MFLQGGDLRYCQKCSHYKPPRAHHCRVCRRCVLRMVCNLCFHSCLNSNVLGDLLNYWLLIVKDHHCIWINNCVGHANYKVFFVFVVYAVIACIYSLVCLLYLCPWFFTVSVLLQNWSSLCCYGMYLLLVFYYFFCFLLVLNLFFHFHLSLLGSCTWLILFQDHNILYFFFLLKFSGLACG